MLCGECFIYRTQVLVVVVSKIEPMEMIRQVKQTIPALHAAKMVSVARGQHFLTCLILTKECAPSIHQALKIYII